MKLIVASTKDPAAKNIVTQLFELYRFKRSPEMPSMHVFEDVVVSMVESEATKMVSPLAQADEVIVASRHVSESGKPALTVHVPGILEKKELAIAAPTTVKLALKALADTSEELGLEYEVSLEATHHGPTELMMPVTFIEIGSSPEQWHDEKAGKVVARAMMTAATSSVKYFQAVGVGGPHYAPSHTEVVLRTDVGIGHILPKYADIDRGLIECAIARTRGGVDLLVADWKGISTDQRRVFRQVASELDIRAVSTREILSGEKL